MLNHAARNQRFCAAVEAAVRGLRGGEGEGEGEDEGEGEAAVRPRALSQRAADGARPVRVLDIGSGA